MVRGAPRAYRSRTDSARTIMTAQPDEVPPLPPPQKWLAPRRPLPPPSEVGTAA